MLGLTRGVGAALSVLSRAALVAFPASLPPPSSTAVAQGLNNWQTEQIARGLQYNDLATPVIPQRLGGDYRVSLIGTHSPYSSKLAISSVCCRDIHLLHRWPTHPGFPLAGLRIIASPAKPRHIAGR
jgi:hypothetical protein